jgi:hypothetical protein
VTEFLSRSAWTRSGPVKVPTPFDALSLKGVAVHYTGSTSPLGSTATLSQSAARLQAERKDHVDSRKWNDIAYNYAIDQSGRVFELRGVNARSAANGDEIRNKHYGAVTFLIGVGDTPTPAALQAFKDWHTQVWLKKWPFAKGVVGHRDLYNTQCPGDALYHLLNFLSQPVQPSTAQPVKGNAVSTTPEVKAIVDELFSDAPDGAYYKIRRPDGSLCSIPVALTEMYHLLTVLVGGKTT